MRRPGQRGRPPSGLPRVTPAPRGEGTALRSALAPPGGAPWAWSALLAAAMLVGYLLLAPRVSGDKDASEFALVLATGGVLHPTGYPIYTVLGHAFVTSLHRAGVGFPQAANAWAALGGAVALFLLHRLALRLLPARGERPRGERFLLAALPVVALGFNPVWMVECTVVEVHSWQLAWACGTALYCAGLVQALATQGARVTRLPLRMAAWGLLCGVGGAHHATAVFVAGGTTLAVAWALVAARRFRAWIPAVWLVAGAVPLLTYGLILHRVSHPGGTEVWPTLEPGLGSLLEHVTGSAYRTYLGSWAPDAAQAAWIHWHILPFLWPGMILMGFLCWNARGERRRVLTGLAVAALGQVAFAYRYGVADPAPYFLPGLAVSVLALGSSAAALLPRLRRVGHGTGYAVAGAIAALVLWIAASVAMMAGRSRALEALDAEYHGAWRAIPHERAIVIWPADEYYRLKEYQRFRGEKPGLDVINTTSLLNRAPRARFRARYGFDPLALTDPRRLAEPARAEYVIGRQPSDIDTRGYASIHQCIAERAGVPVVAFDPPNPPRTLPSGVTVPPPATAR